MIKAFAYIHEGDSVLVSSDWEKEGFDDCYSQAQSKKLKKLSAVFEAENRWKAFDKLKKMGYPVK